MSGIDLEKLAKRVEDAEDRINGLIAYLGIQANNEEWQFIDASDEELGRTVRSALQIRRDPPQSAGSAKLPLQTVVAMTLVLDLQRRFREISEKKA